MKRISRNTKQKLLIESELASFNSFFSAEELHKKALVKDKTLGIATVYRFLADSVNRGKLYSYLCERKNLYSVSKNMHCHFVCEKTGKVIHFELDNLDFLKKIRDKIPGNIHSVQLEIRGVCDKCG